MPPPTTRVGLARVRCFVGPCPVLSLERELAAADAHAPMRPLLSVPGAAPLALMSLTLRLTFE